MNSAKPPALREAEEALREAERHEARCALQRRRRRWSLDGLACVLLALVSWYIACAVFWLWLTGHVNLSAAFEMLAGLWK